MLSNMIKKVRVESGDTQAKLGEKLGVAQRTVAGWESGDRQPPIETLVKMADIYDLSTDYMLERTDDKRPVNKILADIKAAESTNKPVLFAPPQPTTLAAHQTNADDTEIPQDRMDEIIIQAYNLIMSRRRDDT